jgi:hypothetical protein
VAALKTALGRIANDDRVRITLERDRKLVEVTLEVPLAEQVTPATTESKPDRPR